MNAVEKALRCLVRVAPILVISASAVAEVSNKEIARLGTELTPLGAEKAGNADGTIPAWNGGITQAPSGYSVGDHHLDPFANDKILFTINAKNIDQYKDKLSVGHQAMLKAYPSFKLQIYPSHRSASAPQRIYDATKKTAATAKLTEDGNGVVGAVVGYPFPIPKVGLEVVWNHVLRWRGNVAVRKVSQVAPTRSGKYTLVKFEDDLNFVYSHADSTLENLKNLVIYYKQKVVAPARLAGTILLVHETMNQFVEHRKAWIYNPGQRRVRRAPNVAFDNPGTAADGMRTGDQFDIYNGSPERYDWKLVGKKEIYVPYNSYKLHSDSLKYEDIIKPLHINPDHLRYELHRVWVVDGTLKKGARHLYKRRTFYIDEDSWQIQLVDQYDNRDQIWRVSEGHAINYYDVPTFWYTLEVHTDLQAGRYIAFGLDNQSKMYDFTAKRTLSNYTTAALRREGKR